MKRTLWTFILFSIAVPIATADDADAEAFDRFRSEKNVQLMGKFTFVRIKYNSVGTYGEAYYDYDGRRWMRWETDYPEADENFLFRLAELTVCAPNPRAVQISLTDPRLFDYPFVYMCDVGWMDLNPAEMVNLRTYLQQGGFLWVDDFWGDAEWDNLKFIMDDVFPEKDFPGHRWREIPETHPILNIVFGLDKCPQIPARDFADAGWKWDPPDIHRRPAGGEAGVNTVNFMGLFDDRGRLLAVATHNTDIGDGWEREAEDEWYFETYSTLAYAIGINIVVYAMTH